MSALPSNVCSKIGSPAQNKPKFLFTPLKLRLKLMKENLEVIIAMKRLLVSMTKKKESLY